MSKSTISTFELFRMFPDQESTRLYFEARRWPSGAVCPACGEQHRIGTRKGGFYRCNACLLDFTVRKGAAAQVDLRDVSALQVGKTRARAVAGVSARPR